MNLDTDRLVNVVHYHNRPTGLHSIPFRFVAIKVMRDDRNQIGIDSHVIIG